MTRSIPPDCDTTERSDKDLTLILPKVSDETLLEVEPKERGVLKGIITVEPCVGLRERLPDVVLMETSPPEILLTLLIVPLPTSILPKVLLPNWTLPNAPEKTSLLLVPSAINTNLPRLFLYPKNPTLEPPVPVDHLNSMPLSLPSFRSGPVTPPRENIGSAMFVMVL